MWIVVNVDDLGLHPAVARAVEAGATAGVVTSASVLANGTALDDVDRRRRAGAFARVGLGAHLNLVRGRPLSPTREIPSLVDAAGRFLGDVRRVLLRVLGKRLDPEQVELEWDRQIVALKERGFVLDHLDSEKHLHALPRLMPIACRLALRHGIRWVRRPVEPTPPWRLDAGARKAKALSWLSRAHRPVAGVAWPDATFGIADAGLVRAVELGRITRGQHGVRPAARVLEVVCHPGIVVEGDAPLSADLGPLAAPAHWEAEAAALLSPAWRRVLEREGGHLVRFGEVE